MGFAGTPRDVVRRSASATEAGLNGLDSPLRECGEIAAARLSSALSEAVRQAADQLDSQSGLAPASREQVAMLDAAGFSRSCRNRLVSDFRERLEHRYARACLRKPSLLTGYLVDFDVSELRIVEHDLLDDSLAPGMLTEAIRNACWETLHALTTRFSSLLGIDSGRSGDTPLAPKLIEAALSDAVRAQIGRHESKQWLMRALCDHFPKSVSPVYRDLIEFLGTAAPILDSSAGRNDQAAAAPHDTTGAPLASPASAPDQVEANAPARLPAGLAAKGDAGRPAAASVFASAGESRGQPPRRSPVCRDPDGEDKGSRGPTAPGNAAPATPESSLPKPRAGKAPGTRQTAEPSPPPFDLPGRVFGHLARYQAKAVDSSLHVARMLRGRSGTASPSAQSSHPAKAAGKAAGLGQAHPRHQAPAAPERKPVHPGAKTGAPQPKADAKPRRISAEDLKAGTWIELRQPDSSPRELKLAWVSPQRNIFLMTNRQGSRALSLNAEALQAMLMDGRARIIPPPPETAPVVATAPTSGHKKKIA